MCVANNVWILRLCRPYLVKFAHPMQCQSLCWNGVLCNHSQRSRFLGLRTDFVPVHLCLRADLRLCARARVGTRCPLVHSAADCRPSRVGRALLVAPLCSPGRCVWCSAARKDSVFVLLPRTLCCGLSKASYCSFALVKMITKFTPSWVVRFLASNGWFLWFSTWPLIQ